MKAIVLCAGEGTRLQPYTLSVPKCMVPLAGRPLLDYQLTALRQAGIDDVVLVGGHCRQALPQQGVRHVINPQYASTNMVWSLFCAEGELEGDVLVAYGDIVYHVSVVEALLASPRPLAITVDLAWQRLWELRMQDPLSDAESLVLAPDGRVLELGRKPTSYDRIQGQYMGLIKLQAGVLPAFRQHYHGLDRTARYEGRDFPNMFMTTFLQSLIDSGQRVDAVAVQGRWLEVDTVADLETYERYGLERLGVV